jgi:hypothetical protein
MMTISNEEENTTADGEAFATLHNISVLLPTGQNLDNPSKAVNGIVKVTNRSKIARWEMSRSLVNSLGLLGRIR